MKQSPLLTPPTKTFLLGLSISFLILVSFFGGAIADRMFVIKPLDYLFNRHSLPAAQLESANQAPSLLGSLLGERSDLGVADVTELASASVVTVSIKREQQIFEPFGGDIFGFNPFLPFGGGTTRTEQIQRDIGTGFVVEGNLIVTNRHVVSDTMAEYLIIDKNDVEYQVENIYRDPAIDMAILKVKGIDDLPVLSLGDSDQLRVGESVIAIGTALGEFRHTVTTGVVSGLGRGITATDGFGMESLEGVIQTDAAINPGNSGGPLLNSRGQVIGVNVATSARAENIGFAIPINTVKASLDNFNQTGQFARPFFGVRYQMISQQAALFNEVPQGAYLVEVIPGSSADQAGLRTGDILLEFGGERLVDEVNLASLINQRSIGETVEVRYWRDGQTQTLNLRLMGQQ